MEYFEAPWKLKGKGYIFLYKFNKRFIKDLSCIKETDKEGFCGGFGCMMIVDYETSNVGPYGEVLFIPGKSGGRKKFYSIPKIYVSSQSSIINGRRNWGIPKELAKFDFKDTVKGVESIHISTDKGTIMRITINSYGPKFPVTTKLLSFPLRQHYEEQFFYTCFSGKGIGRLSKIVDFSIDSELFPDVAQFKPIAVVKVDDFNIIFPKADIEEA